MMFGLSFLRRVVLVLILCVLIGGADSLMSLSGFAQDESRSNAMFQHMDVRGYSSYRSDAVKFYLSAPAYKQNVNSSWRSLRTFPLMESMQVPIHVYVDTPNNTLYQPHYYQYVKDALDSWSSAVDGNLHYVFVSDPNDAHIRIYWIPGFNNDPFKAGESNYGIADAMVRIKTVNIPDREIKANIMHELGHVMGLGHSANQGDIMVAFRKWNHDPNYEPRLSARDVAAIRLLYSPQWQQGEDVYQALSTAVTY